MRRIISSLSLVAIMVACSSPEAEQSTKPESAPKEEVQSTPQEDESSDKMKPNQGLEEMRTAESFSMTISTVGETMTDMAYEPKMMVVKEGATVTINLVNEAKSEAMIHNLVIIKPGTQEEVNALAMEVGPDGDYIPDSEHIIAASGLVNPGEESKVTFKAPEAGTYQFICTYPGHIAMKGIMVVK